MEKPLNRKNYGSIGHLLSSRMGPSDHHVHEGQQRICTEKARDKHDTIIITEKLDGSNVGIAKVGDNIYALGRAGYLAQTSKYEQYQLFAAWVREREDHFRKMLEDGQRLIGEWLAQAHGTRYSLPYGPFIAFDIMEGDKRKSWKYLCDTCGIYGIPMPYPIHYGSPMSVEEAMGRHENTHGFHPDDGPEGIVYRVERRGEFDFMAKWVRPNKIDGKYLPEISGKEAIWNWRPKSAER